MCVVSARTHPHMRVVSSNYLNKKFNVIVSLNTIREGISHLNGWLLFVISYNYLLKKVNVNLAFFLFFHISPYLLLKGLGLSLCNPSNNETQLFCRNRRCIISLLPACSLPLHFDWSLD